VLSTAKTGKKTLLHNTDHGILLDAQQSERILKNFTLALSSDLASLLLVAAVHVRFFPVSRPRAVFESRSSPCGPFQFSGRIF
jgi:hypothetical protein